MFITWLIDWFERRTGTSVTLPDHTIELYLPAAVFDRLGADGYCVDRRLMDDFIGMVVRRGRLSPRLSTALEEACDRVIRADESITHVIFCTARPTMPWDLSWSERACVHRSLVNHERLHATTMRRSDLWHAVADGVLESRFGDVWARPREAMLRLPTYASMVSAGADEAQLATSEMLARVAAVLHAPRHMRQTAARYQLENEPDGLLELADAVYDRWSSTEALIGWLDAKIE